MSQSELELRPDSTRSPSLYRLAWVFYLVLAIVGLLWTGSRRGHLGVELFVVPATFWIDLAGGAVAGVLLLALWQGLRQLLPAARRLETELGKLVANLTSAEAVALAILSAVGEELFFRSALQGAIGLVPAALVFALLHGGPGRSYRAWGLFALVAGLLFGLLVSWRDGAVGSAILAHALVNGVNLVRLSRPSPGSDHRTAE